MAPVELHEIARSYCSDKGYSFLDTVGSGAFKETFHVRDGAGASFALKVHKPGASTLRTDREIEAMKRCDHPNIARLASVDSWTYESVQYLIAIEEFLSGGTLGRRLKEVGVVPAPELKQLGTLLIDAIGHIAANGLVHRDLKPENVLFRDDSTPVVVDFGLVRDLEAHSLTNTWQLRGPGTPFFSPPEQLLNEKHLIDWRADQFSLAVSLSLAAFGFHPYEDTGLPAGHVVDRVAQRQQPVQRFQLAVSESGLSALALMVSPWPVTRYRTPSDLATAWSEQDV